VARKRMFDNWRAWAAELILWTNPPMDAPELQWRMERFSNNHFDAGPARTLYTALDEPEGGIRAVSLGNDIFARMRGQ
jgi:hypothetical protein